MKILVVVCWLGALSLQAASVPAGGPAEWAAAGRLQFAQCEFKKAARTFTKAVQLRPEDASLHLWLGRSYARMAEVAGLLHAAANARKARRSFERAIELEPHNHAYLRELFDFYLDSPEWFGGGLNRAAQLVGRIAPDDPGEQAFLRVLLEGARQEYHGAFLAEIGRVVP